MSLLSMGLLLAQPGFAKSADLASASIAVKMSAFEMPAEYNCPLFSNSPYTDMLNSLDKMQDNLNQVFPQCENKANHVKLNETSDKLHKKVLEAQSFQKNGQTYKLSLSANTIVDLTRVLQQSLVSMSQAQTKACYRSEAQFRSVIFSINDTFQSLSPLILDIATQNPAIGQTLGPTLKILAGADAISKGLSLIEQIAKDSIQFDMTDKDNRINTVKNTCQFMKLYNRLTYLRLSRLGQVQSIHQKFQTEISEIQSKVRIANVNRSEALPAGSRKFPMFVAGNDSRVVGDRALVLFEKLKVSGPAEQSKIQKALSDFDDAKKDNFSEITQCQVIKTSLKSTSLQEFLVDLKDFSESAKINYNIETELDIIAEYQSELQKVIANGSRSLCTQFGQDWLRKVDQIFILGRQMGAQYEVQLVELNGEAYLIKQKKLAKDAEKLQAIESDYKNLKTMLNYASFESSEMEKRAKGMHKYLFAGPDKVVSECATRAKEEKCGVVDGVAGIAKAFYQEYRNQGPVYELVLNNEKYFNESYDKMNRAMIYLQRYEDQFLPAAIQAKKNSPVKKTFEEYFAAREKNAFAMDHMTTKFLVKGTSGHTQVCSQAKLVVSEYLKATDHMMSTYGMCEMIKNVMHEPDVSKKLKAYCMPISDREDSKLNQLRYRLAGRSDAPSKRPGTGVLYFNRSPKAFVDQVLVRMNELGCYN